MFRDEDNCFTRYEGDTEKYCLTCKWLYSIIENMPKHPKSTLWQIQLIIDTMEKMGDCGERRE